jgi:hypothetical protein
LVDYCVDRNHVQSQGLVDLFTALQQRIEGINQVIYITTSETTKTVDTARVAITADFYRIGAAVYLHSVMQQQTVDQDALRRLVDAGLQLLAQMEPCTSPWPLFVIACNVVGDTDRSKILSSLKGMNEARHIGNCLIIKRLILAIWKRIDLRADEVNPANVDWRRLASTIPSFI